MSKRKGKVLMAMSGGIDSSVAALLLLKEGYELVGVTFYNFDSIPDSCDAKQDSYNREESIMEAKSLAEKLGFEHHTLDIREEFKSTIIANFIDEYIHGRTPNPCVLCNAYVKWGLLMNEMRKRECNYIATGHYAQIQQENGRYFLQKGKDITKDQTYFLWMLTQQNLASTLFPLGEMTKQAVRKIAATNGFDTLSKKDESQEICFIPQNDYRHFLENNIENYSLRFPSGDFLNTAGDVVGKHSGYPNYTIGQRKGLGVALGYPAYVIAINPKLNQVILGKKEELFGDSCFIKNVNLMKYDTLPTDKPFTVRIRYRNEGVLARLQQEEEGIVCQFLTPIDAITPGQSAVFYENDDLVGGGVIQ